MTQSKSALAADALRAAIRSTAVEARPDMMEALDAVMREAAKQAEAPIARKTGDEGSILFGCCRVCSTTWPLAKLPLAMTSLAAVTRGARCPFCEADKPNVGYDPLRPSYNDGLRRAIALAQAEVAAHVACQVPEAPIVEAAFETFISMLGLEINRLRRPPAEGEVSVDG